MTEEQKAARAWLSRAYRADSEVTALYHVLEQNKHIARMCEEDSELRKKVDEESAELEKRIQELIIIRAEIQQAINSLGNSKYTDILKMRYLGNANMQSIADNMGYEIKTIQRKHNIALDKIYTKMSLNVAFIK